MSRARDIELFVDSAGHKIVDHNGRAIPLEVARRLWESGRVGNWNHAFQRLATYAGWDWSELDRQYREMDAARG